ncbi:MAG: peptidylprolyl isomerase [Lentisphaeria bacterium]|nr:peptidylprolyl isomerase [Lentisphaeria bacterium]
MKKSFFSVISALVFSAGVMNAQEAAPAAAEAAPAAAVEEAVAAAKPAVAAPTLDVNALFALIPEVVSTANGKTLVTKAQVLEIAKPNIESAVAQGAPIAAETVQAFVYQVARSLSLRGILLEEARNAKIEGDEAAAKAQIEQYKEMAKLQGGEKAFEEQLKQIGKTEDEVLLMFIEEGMIQKLSEKLDAEAAAKVKEPAEEEVKAFYDTNKPAFVTPETLSASHILVQFPSQNATDDEKAAALAKIKEIKSKIAEDGSNFGDLAKEFSDCPSKERGGDLGQFEKNQMVPEFEAALLKLKEGEISEPVETMFGYHLIKAGAHTAEAVVPFEEAKEQIVAYLKQGAMAKEAKKLMDGLTEKAGMKILLPEPKMPTFEVPEAE